VENGVVWGSYGHSGSLEIAPFDRAHASSYYPFIVTSFLVYSEITYPSSNWRPRWGCRAGLSWIVEPDVSL